MRRFRGFLFFLLFAAGSWCGCAFAQNNPHVVLDTNYGAIVVELFAADAPVTVDNFLGYVNSGFYDGLLFHRVIYEFMIQGGGYYVTGNTIYRQTPYAPAIINESDNGLSNVRGTIAMARGGDPNSAGSQFFINHDDNLSLDRENAEDGFGYCVFGQVVSGMDVVDAIAAFPTVDLDPYNPYDAFNYFPYNSLLPDDPLVEIDRAYVRPCGGAHCSDISGDGDVGFEDFVLFISHWLDDDCGSANDFCGGNDLDYNGRCDFADLALFSAHWRVSTEE